MEDKYLLPSTESECAENGKPVRSLVDENDAVIGYMNFARFHLDGKYENELQRQHIFRELIEYGFEKARALGYRAVIVEGNPMNCRITISHILRFRRQAGAKW